MTTTVNGTSVSTPACYDHCTSDIRRAYLYAFIDAVEDGCDWDEAKQAAKEAADEAWEIEDEHIASVSY